MISFRLQIILVAIVVLADIHYVASVTLPSTTSRKLPKVPIYGNWCGPGHDMCPRRNLQSCNLSGHCIDSVDCACKRHDICAYTHGVFNCKCDQKLVRDLRHSGHPIGKLISTIINFSPCKAPLNLPTVKRCSKCRRIFRKRRCIRYPCVRMRCRMVWNALPKILVRRFSC